MKYSLQILKNRNLFKRHKYPSPNAWNIKMFLDHQLYKHLRVLGTTKLSNLNFKKLVCPKNVWMRHSAGSYLFPSYLFVLFGFFVFFFLLPYYFKIELEAAQSQLHLNSLQCIPNCTVFDNHSRFSISKSVVKVPTRLQKTMQKLCSYRQLKIFQKYLASQLGAWKLQQVATFQKCNSP